MCCVWGSVTHGIFQPGRVMFSKLLSVPPPPLSPLPLSFLSLPPVVKLDSKMEDTFLEILKKSGSKPLVVLCKIQLLLFTCISMRWRQQEATPDWQTFLVYDCTSDEHHGSVDFDECHFVETGVFAGLPVLAAVLEHLLAIYYLLAGTTTTQTNVQKYL